MDSHNISPHTPAARNIDILVVEDSPTQAEKLQYLIRKKGYQVQIAPNGRIALEMIRAQRPSLVLSDIVMPEMDGYTLCHALKSDPASHDIPVILVTSLTDPKDIVRGLESGADNFIRKPYAEDYLLARIDQVLMNQKLRMHNKVEIGIGLYLGGQQHFINAGRQQILDLLISTYEQAVLVNDELKAREQQVHELNFRLAQHAGKLEATNREIARQNLELERINRMKSEFLANMSHELRTPLNAIIGFSRILSDNLLGELTAPQKNCASNIFDSGKHLLSLINDLLDLSKIEAGKMELVLESSDVEPLLQNSLTILKENALKHHIDLDLDTEKLGKVLLDQRRTKQIIYNLLSNAVKFTPDGGKVILRARRVEGMRLPDNVTIVAGTPDSLAYLELSIADTGIGINQEELGRLFQPFVQLDSTLSRKYEGTGLGLALVKQLVELHDGVLAVRSTPGLGSEFIVWLPYR